MAKYIKRLFGKTVEEAMVVQAKICRVQGSARAPYRDLYFEWTRGDTVESSAPFGEISDSALDMNLAIIFNKLSIFFRQVDASNTNGGVY